MKKIISVFYLFLSTMAFVYSQTEVDTMQTEVESDCDTNLENIFKVHDLRIKFETVLFIYKHKEGGFHKNNSFLNNSFQLIRGIPYFKEQKDSISGVSSGELVKVEFMSKEEMSQYIEQLNCTPEEASNEYEDFVRNIQFEKDMYLRCIDIELTKGGESEYAKDEIFYSFGHPWSSLLPPMITKLDFLKVFKEFVLNDNKGGMPDSVRAFVFLNCGCKIPPFVSLSPIQNKKQ